MKNLLDQTTNSELSFFSNFFASFVERCHNKLISTEVNNYLAKKTPQLLVS